MKPATLLRIIIGAAGCLIGIAVPLVQVEDRRSAAPTSAKPAATTVPAATSSTNRPTSTDPCSDDPADGNLYVPGPWISGRFTGPDGRPYRLQLLAENWKDCSSHPEQGFITAIVYRNFGDTAQVASARRLFQIGRYGAVPTLADNAVRLTSLGTTSRGTAYLAVGYSWWDGHGDDIEARSAAIVSVSFGSGRSPAIGYHGEVDTALEGCTLEPAHGRATRAILYPTDWDCEERLPFGYRGALTLDTSAPTTPDLRVLIAPGGTDRDEEEFHRIRARNRTYRQDQDGIYQRVR